MLDRSAAMMSSFASAPTRKPALRADLVALVQADTKYRPLVEQYLLARVECDAVDLRLGSEAAVEEKVTISRHLDGDVLGTKAGHWRGDGEQVERTVDLDRHVISIGVWSH